jgi:hypothetical protein
MQYQVLAPPEEVLTGPDLVAKDRVYFTESNKGSLWVILYFQHLAQRVGNCGARPRRARVVCMRTFILKWIWAQDIIYILVNISLVWNILFITYYRYWLRTISSTFCRRLKLEKWTSCEIYVFELICMEGWMMFMNHFKGDTSYKSVTSDLVSWYGWNRTMTELYTGTGIILILLF